MKTRVLRIRWYAPDGKFDGYERGTLRQFYDQHKLMERTHTAKNDNDSLQYVFRSPDGSVARLYRA